MKKQLLSMLLALCMIITVSPASYAFAPRSGTCGPNLSWDLTSDGLLTIRGTGPMKDFVVEDYMGPDLGYRQTYSSGPWQGTGVAVKTAIIEPGVTSIGICAFGQSCPSMTSISIPDTVTEIGMKAFEECQDLTDVFIPYGISEIKEMTFAGCRSLTHVDIPGSVSKIEDCAFWGCQGLKSISLPEGITEIGLSAFMGCSSLSDLKLPDSITEISDAAFCECAFSSIEIPSKIAVIPTSIFQDCKNLTSVTIPNSVKEIEASAFLRCEALSDIYYDGSKEQWDTIEIGDSNQPLRDATIHFSVRSPEPEATAGTAPLEPKYTPPMDIKKPHSYNFIDVPSTSPYAEAINWAVNQGITNGKTPTSFAPNEQCTHAQILTFLWRGYGEPEPSIYNPFTDRKSTRLNSSHL